MLFAAVHWLNFCTDIFQFWSHTCICCVFGCDDNANKIFGKANQVAVKEKYKLSFSNPSFEIWFLLHFNNQIAPVENCDTAIRFFFKFLHITNRWSAPPAGVWNQRFVICSAKNPQWRRENFHVALSLSRIVCTSIEIFIK